jgi:lactose/L-arabinose transport system ATP-binding protein
MTLADKIVVLRKGQVEQVGPPLELYEDPNNVFVAGFIGSPKMNFFKATVDRDGTLQFASARIQVPFSANAVSSGSAITVGIRPEHFDRNPRPDATIKVMVDFVEHLGGTSFVHGHLATGEKIIVEHRDAGNLKTGNSLTAGFKMRDVRAFDADGKRLR